MGQKKGDINRRILIIRRSISDDVVDKFESIRQKFHYLEFAAGYVDLLSEVGSLSVQARRNFKSSSQEASSYISGSGRWLSP